MIFHILAAFFTIIVNVKIKYKSYSNEKHILLQWHLFFVAFLCESSIFKCYSIHRKRENFIIFLMEFGRIQVLKPMLK